MTKINLDKNKIIGIMASVLFLCCSYLILTGSPVTTMALMEDYNLPAGSFIAWIGLTCLQTAVYYSFSSIHKPKKLFLMIISVLIKMTGLIAFFWGIISFILSGNWSFNFASNEGFTGSMEASNTFWRITYLLIIIPLVSVIILTINELILKLKANRK